jgi:hypothetical protein
MRTEKIMMNFELNHNDINYNIELIREFNFIPCDRYEKLGYRSLVALKKEEILPYTLKITSKKEGATQTHYWSTVLLTSLADELQEELAQYLDDESIIDQIEKSWKHFFDEDGPIWKI